MLQARWHDCSAGSGVRTRNGNTFASTAAGGTLQVANADSALIVIASATSYKKYNDVSGDPKALAAGLVDKAAAKPPAATMPEMT